VADEERRGGALAGAHHQRMDIVDNVRKDSQSGKN